MTQSRVDIHLVSWHRPEMTDLVIRSIAKNTKPDSYRLMVFDNGSPEEQQTHLLDLQNDGLIDELFLNDKNIGLELARNRLLNMSESEFIVCLDNDCLPVPIEDGVDWVEKLVKLMRDNPTYAAISSRTQVMIGTGNIFDEHEDEDIVNFPHPGGSFRIMRTSVVKLVGGWEGKPGRGSEERYICGKLHEAGWDTGFAVKVPTLHLFGVRGNNTDRWGYDESWKPEETGHSDIWHPVLQNGDEYNDVLEYVGKDLTERYFNAISNPTAD